jgi:N-methylhydantoinase B
VTEYGLEPDSGGPGEYRGGLAFRRQYRLLADDAVCTLRSDRREHPPYGIAGGMPGGGSRNLLRTGGKERLLPTMPMEAIALKKGDTFLHIAAGGGGFGDPKKRAPEKVRADVVAGKVSLASARKDYGVALDPKSLAIDVEATQKLRTSKKPAKRPKERVTA